MKIQDLNSVTFRDETTSAYSGQTNSVLSVMHHGDVVGYLKYSVYQGIPSIQYIEVVDGRKGFGSLLVKKLQSLYPDVEIDWGYTTPDGEKLRKSLQYEKRKSEFYDSLLELERLKAEKRIIKKRTESLMDKTDLSQEDKEPINDLFEILNELYDKISSLEEATYGKKLYDLIIKY